MATPEHDSQPSPDDGYIISADAERVAALERRQLGLAADQPTAALAFSGGGVRSASFALGVLQALLARLGPGPRSPDPLDRFHYLSTVSGGGYLGLALLWLRARQPVTGDGREDYRRHFGSKQRGARSGLRGIWLDYFRQHGNYLLPRGLGTLSLIGVALRALLLSGAVYFGLAVVLMVAALRAQVLLPPPLQASGSCRPLPWPRDAVLCTAIDAVSLLAFGGAAFAAACVLFGLGTFVASFVGWRRWLAALLLAAVVAGAAVFALALPDPDWSVRAGFALLGAATAAMLVLALMVLRLLHRRTAAGDRQRPAGAPPPRPLVASASWMYRIRLDLQVALGMLLAVLVGLAVLASLPLVAHALGNATLAGVLTGLGVIGGYYQTVSGRSKPRGGSALGSLRIVLTAAALGYGLLLGAYLVADGLQASIGPGQLLGITIALLLVGTLLNLNLVGLGRMYRDRLMETFLPDDETVDSNSWGPATGADDDREGRLETLWQRSGARGLYPLANTHVVLVDSISDLYRNRGGDSFLLSPLYCGSDATGWVRTDRFEGGQLTAATAMATSGAAANPNSGPGGRGVTRNRLVSFLMFFVQARLGVWVGNPRRAPGLFHRVGKLLPPNLIHPGIVSGLFGRRLKETTSFVELSDGGHFDNTGLYELIRRRVTLVVLAQASADPGYAMADLANAVEKIRVDFGVHLRFDEGIGLDGVPPTIDGTGQGIGRRYAERGYAIARIDYPPVGDIPAQHGWLLYLQAVPVAGVPSDVHAYYRACPAFSNESTADQFFDEVQLEAYRELGYTITRGVLRDLEAPDFAAPPARALIRELLGL